MHHFPSWTLQVFSNYTGIATRPWNGSSHVERTDAFVKAVIRVYLSEIVISFKYPTQPWAHVLALLRNVIMTWELKKCRSVTETVDYTGLAIISSRLEIALDTTSAIF